MFSAGLFTVWTLTNAHDILTLYKGFNHFDNQLIHVLSSASHIWELAVFLCEYLGFGQQVKIKQDTLPEVTVLLMVKWGQ